MPTPPPTIIFDFGGVLLDWNPRYLYRKLFPGDEPAMERFLAEIGFSEWNRQQDAGRPFSIAVAELCARHPQYCDLIHAYDERFLEAVGGAIPGTVDILRRLHLAGFPLYGLSNWSAEKFRLVRPRYAVLRLVPGHGHLRRGGGCQARPAHLSPAAASRSLARQGNAC